MLLVQDEYTVFLLQIEFCSRRILVSAFGFRFSSSLNKAALTEAFDTAK